MSAGYQIGLAKRRLSAEEEERTVKARRDGEIGIDGARDLSEGTVPADRCRGDEHAGFGRVVHLHRQVTIGRNTKTMTHPGSRVDQLAHLQSRRPHRALSSRNGREALACKISTILPSYHRYAYHYRLQ